MKATQQLHDLGQSLWMGVISTKCAQLKKTG
jgi:hypothetical protein